MGYVTHLECTACGSCIEYREIANLCPVDGQPLRIRYDLERLATERGRLGWWRPDRPSLWRFGGLLPLDWDDEADRGRIVTLGEGHTPQLDYDHPLARRVGFALQVKDEGKPHAGFGRNPTLSFKDRGMAMTVSLARGLGLTRLALPTQGNAGDSLAAYAVAAGLEAVVVMSSDTDRAVLGSVAAQARLYPANVVLELVEGTILECGQRVREHWVPAGYFNVATFQEPGWRIEGKKTLGLELAEPREGRDWRLPDVIIYPTGGGTGVLGMAKAFDELEALGLVDSRRPRMVCVQSEATNPLVRAFEAGAEDITPEPPGRTIATGLNVGRNVGHREVLRIVRASGGCATDVSEDAIRETIAREWRERRFGWSPEGAAALAALPKLVECGQVRAGDWVVVVNTAAAEKSLATIRELLGGGP
jgi:threonine synthase